jgi:hypothetical protein
LAGNYCLILSHKVNDLFDWTGTVFRPSPITTERIETYLGMSLCYTYEEMELKPARRQFLVVYGYAISHRLGITTVPYRALHAMEGRLCGVSRARPLTSIPGATLASLCPSSSTIAFPSLRLLLSQYFYRAGMLDITSMHSSTKAPHFKSRNGCGRCKAKKVCALH